MEFECIYPGDSLGHKSICGGGRIERFLLHMNYASIKSRKVTLLSRLYYILFCTPNCYYVHPDEQDPSSGATNCLHRR